LHPGYPAVEEFDVHRLSWSDLDLIARGGGGAAIVRRLRLAERSRRLLLLRAVMDEAAKAPELTGPLPSLEEAWELLVRVQEKAPAVLDRLLSHPYTGSWAGYTTRLLRHRITGVCPVWVHVGHLHALACAAGIRAGLDFHAEIPLWHGGAALPTLGLAMLPVEDAYSVAQVRATHGRVTVSLGSASVQLPADLFSDAPGWLGTRRLCVHACGRRLAVRLDDLDPYRGLYEPVPPQRLDDFEVESWRALLAEAWRLIGRCLPQLAEAIPHGLDSLVPKPAVPFRQPSASTGEAFGSAIVALPADGATLAATLVHEFQHIRLGGLLHLVKLHDEDHRERFYTGWRDDPRPIGGVLQGVYAFFGVTAFWRALARAGDGITTRRAEFEFAYWRGQTWRTLAAFRRDAGLTAVGRRFADGIAEVLGPWLDERVPADLVAAAAACAEDHRAGWRIRFVRPDHTMVATLAQAWRCGMSRPPIASLPLDPAPTPVPDGSWSRARSDLIRLRVCEPWPVVAQAWSMVPDATVADYAYATGRFVDALNGYRAELAANPDRPASWIGLGMAMTACRPGSAARALLRYPEIVRAVHRDLRSGPATAPAPDELAAWIGRSLR